jgi:predicted transcriptional regulator
LRKRIGISQVELAKRAGVSQALIARIEAGTVDPRLSTYSKIWDVLRRAGEEMKLAKDVMAKPVIGVSPKDPISKAADLMKKHDISQLPIISERRAVGSLTEDTIAREAFKYRSKREFFALPISEIMEEPFPIVGPSTDLQTLSALLNRSPAVIISKGGKIVGIVTEIDVIRAMMEK